MANPFPWTPAATAADPSDHNTRHENGGADEIAVTGLSGLLADDQHVLDSEVIAAVKTALDYGLSFEAPVTTYTDTTHFKASSLIGKGDNFFKGYYAYVVWDADGAGAAPQGERQLVSAFTSSDGTVTHAAFTTPLAVTDIVLMIHPYIAYLLELAAANIPADLDTLLSRVTAAVALASSLTTHDTDIKGLLATIAGYIDTEVASILAAVDTEVGAIKTQTDKIGDASIGLANIKALIDTLTAYVDLEVAAILADTGELQTDWVDGGRLDLLVDAIKAKTDVIVAGGATEANVDAVETKVDTVDTNVDSILADTADMQPKLGAPAGASISADIAAVKTVVDAIPTTAMRGTDNAALASVLGAAVGASISADIAAIKAVADAIPTTAMRGTDNAALASVLGALADAAAEGAVTDVDTAMAYIKQLVTLVLAGSGGGVPTATDWKGSFNWDTSVYTNTEIDISALFSTTLDLTTRRKYTVYLDLTAVAADASFVSAYIAVKTKVDGTNYRAIDRKTALKAGLAATAEPGIIISIPAVAENVQITIQMSTALGADATIYYAVVKEHLE